MSDFTWSGDRFRTELAERLIGLLACARDDAALAKAVRGSAAAAEAVCQGREMACKPGCPYCCVLNVAVLLPEAMIIAEWMRERLLPSDLDDIQERLKEHRSWTRWMDDEERVAKHAACPLLDAAGSCSIHPVRPLECRSVTSLDSASCRDALAPGITDEPRLVPTDLLRRAAFDEAFAALARALKVNGLDDRSIELGTGVLAFLESPERREELLGGRRLPDALWR